MTGSQPQPLGPPDLAWLAAAAGAAGARTALVWQGRTVTFAALDVGARRAASDLSAAGVERHGRLAVLMHASIRFVELLHACQRLGVVFAPLNDRLTDDELRAQLSLLQPRCLLYDRAHRDTALRLAAGDAAWNALDATAEVTAPTARGDDADSTSAMRIDPNAVWTILFTSGTTAEPKGVQLTNANHRASAISAIANLGNREQDRWLCSLPLCHVGGLSILMRAALYATPVVLLEHFDANRAWQAIERERVTLVSLVTPMLQKLLDVDAAPEAGRSLRCVLLGGGPMPAALLERARAAGLPIALSYGMTETGSQVTATMPGQPLADATSAGRPLPGVSVRIDGADADGFGEILVRAPQVTAGYLAATPSTTAVAQDGWLRTGDLGRLDADGCLHVVARRSDLIVSGGENVVPDVVESVLLAHPDVTEAAVFGVADDTWGQLVAAAVVPRAGARVSEAELLAWCAQHLARHQRPRRLELVAELPRTAGGKLRRRALRDRAVRA